MPGHVHDPRHRYSYELRPDRDLDARLRSLAAGLERDRLLERGASTAPRFHPHLTFCRAAQLVDAAVHAAATTIAAAGPELELAAAGTFGDGRIIWLAPSRPEKLVAARATLIEQLDPHTLDPLALSRAWTPHVTVAYAVPAHARARALEQVRAALPVRGRWARAQGWDLDVRPTRLVHDVACVGTAPPG